MKKRGYLKEKEALIEQRIRERLQSQESQIVQDLRKQGNIHEAAVVFSKEGFSFFIDNISHTIARELTPYIEEVVDKKVTCLLTQLVERLEQKANSKTESEKRLSRWTKEEDNLLLNAVDSYLQKPGRKVKDALKFVHKKHLPQRSLRAVTLRYYYLLSQRGES